MKLSLRNILAVAVMIPLISTLSACGSVDYSQFPFYDDLFGEKQPSVRGPRRIPAHQPLPGHFDNYQKPVFNEGYFKDRQKEVKSSEYAAYRSHSVSTDMFETGVHADPSLFSDEPLMLKDFEYRDTPDTAEGSVTPGSKASVWTENGAFVPERTLTPPVIQGGYFSRSSHDGHPYFANK